MKKMILALTILTLLFSVSFAQTNVDVSATVENAALTIGTPTDVGFGIVAKSATQVLSPRTGTAHSVGIGTPVVGEVSITGEAGASFEISFPTAAISLSNGTSTMAFTADVVGNNTGVQTASGAGDDLAASTTHTVTLSGTLGSGLTGDFDIWIGGSLVVGPTQGAGSYDASAAPLAFTIEYP